MAPHPYRLYAFGSNGEAQLGLGFASDKVLAPTLVPETETMRHFNVLSTLKHIRGGGNHTLIVTAAGYAFGAGDNRDSQIHFQRSDDEVDGRLHHFAYSINGAGMYCLATAWKSSAFPLLGFGGPLEDEECPTEQTLLMTIGRGEWGELGRPGVVACPDPASGPPAPIHEEGCAEPMRVDGPEALEPIIEAPVVEIAAGMYHYVIITYKQTSSGQVFGWGRAKNGQLGAGHRDARIVAKPTPLRDIPFLAVKVACGQYFTYLVGSRESGDHIVLGDDKHGIKSKAPPHVTGWKDIGATWNAIFVLFEDGTLTAWGKSDLWELIPPNLPKIEQIAVGSDHIIALTQDKKIISWGWAVHGNCGDVGTLKQPLVKGYVTGQWNEIALEGEPVLLGAGYSTSFVLTKRSEEEAGAEEKEKEAAAEEHDRLRRELERQRQREIQQERERKKPHWMNVLERVSFF